MEAVKPNITFDKSNENPILGINLFNQQYEKSLDANQEKQEACTKHKDELCNVRSHLETLPNELSYDVMIPIGSQGLMRGKMVHTNEILALIGDGWYVKTSAKNAVDMCQRRIERCDEVLNTYVKEFELLKSWREVSHDVFQPPDGDVREIMEDYDEDKEEDWRVVHRENVRKHYLELAKLRNKENKVTVDDEDALQRRLDELELQEEMEDELIRSGEDIDAFSSDSEDSDENNSSDYNKTKYNETDSLNSSGASYAKRRVSFSEVVQEVDLEFEEEKKPEPLRIFFHHSDVPVSTSKVDGSSTAKISPCELESPSDMYDHFSSLFPSKPTPKGILKQTSGTSSVEENGDSISSSPLPEWTPSIAKTFATGMGDWDANEENEQPSPHVVAFGDIIMEHNPVAEIQVAEDQALVTRPVSRFKASRKKQKMKEK